MNCCQVLQLDGKRHSARHGRPHHWGDAGWSVQICASGSSLRVPQRHQWIFGGKNRSCTGNGKVKTHKMVRKKKTTQKNPLFNGIIFDLEYKVKGNIKLQSYAHVCWFVEVYVCTCVCVCVCVCVSVCVCVHVCVHVCKWSLLHSHHCMCLHLLLSKITFKRKKVTVLAGIVDMIW